MVNRQALTDMLKALKTSGNLEGVVIVLKTREVESLVVAYANDGVTNEQKHQKALTLLVNALASRI